MSHQQTLVRGIQNGQLVRVGGKIGRNEPCHCGSGKKYKRCCLEPDRREQSDVLAQVRQVQAKRRAERERLAKQAAAARQAEEEALLAGLVPMVSPGGELLTRMPGEEEPAEEEANLKIVAEQVEGNDE